MTPINQTTNGKLYAVRTPEGAFFKVLHSYGTAEEMGEAQGLLLGPLAYEFLTVGLEQYFESIVAQLNIKGLPEWLQQFLEDKAGPNLIKAALGAIFQREQEHFFAARSNPKDEITGMARGICASGAVENCDEAALVEKLEHLNMLTELVRMTCSMFGAWGSATPTGHLIQVPISIGQRSYIRKW